MKFWVFVHDDVSRKTTEVMRKTYTSQPVSIRRHLPAVQSWRSTRPDIDTRTATPNCQCANKAIVFVQTGTYRSSTEITTSVYPPIQFGWKGCTCIGKIYQFKGLQVSRRMVNSCPRHGYWQIKQYIAIFTTEDIIHIRTNDIVPCDTTILP